MPFHSGITLTEEQKNLLESLEEEFKHRYTEKDEDFIATFNAKPSLPPVYDNWIGQGYERRHWNPYPKNRYWHGDDRYNRQDRDSLESTSSQSDRYYHRHTYFRNERSRPY